MESNIILLVPSAGVAALLFAFYLFLWVKRKPMGTKKMEELSKAIKEGANAFLHTEYRVLILFILAMLVLLIFASLVFGAFPLSMAVAFILGALCSTLTGNLGMRSATNANARTAKAVEQSFNDGMLVAFRSGVVTSLAIVGTGIIGLYLLYELFHTTVILFGFGLGASSIALFARVGGGIYTKSADVGADMVGKVEAGIPEDDPRNPAVIADQVGDNVGDVAGMGADLFESYVDSIIATMALGAVAGGFALETFGHNAVLLPLIISAIGIIASIVGTFFVRTRQVNVYQAMNKGLFAVAAFTAVFSALATWLLVKSLNPFFAMLAGLIAGLIIGFATQYFTSEKAKPAQSIAKAAETGAATNIIQGMATGMLSTVVPVLATCVAMLLAYQFASFYGVALAAVGMLSILGISLATDCYGPVADNAAGIAELTGMGEEVRKKAEELDAVGNTMAAISKGFAIGSAAITALALLFTFVTQAGVEFSQISLMQPEVIAGLFLGAMLPFCFSALTMGAVGRTARKMVEEVRRQFRELELLTGKNKPQYAKCVEISTKNAIKEMILPSLIAIIAPLLVGLLLGIAALAGMLAGATATGFLLALFFANSGGAWDNAKKFIESGQLGGKGSEAHKAAVIGDTVGDPCKDTSGPSLNILIKLMSIVSLVFVPLLIKFGPLV
ncbi:MAG TPA: sodium-translocating pyrophosphatase [Thermoplasmata archaeon]|nr:sodium-translocating pyrophosphatase [Thermoplasmata archaeon]